MASISKQFQTGRNITLYGDWDKFSKLSKNMDRDFKMGTRMGSRQAADKYYRQIRKNIKSGASGFGYPEVKGKYANRKERHSFLNTLFQFYGYYYRAIKKTDTEWSTSVHMKKGAVNPKTGGKYTMANIAVVLEKGNGEIVPARPLWQDTFDRFGGKTWAHKEIVLGIKRHFKRKYGINLTQ